MSAQSPPRTVFASVRAELNFPADEDRILAYWKEHGIFHKTLDSETRATGPSRGTKVFYEGPPTANGMPHNGHVLTRAVKDVFPRYWTMCGWDVPRKAGWDTHGLPVEVEVEKELRIHGKADIQAFGVRPFISRCLASVFRYTDAWEKLTDKIGFWVDLPTAYVTYHREYVESVWWALGELHKKGLLYRGHRVCWWWPQGGTALSAAEVGSNYKTVDDPSVYVAFPLRDEPDTALCAWTTTPWTLPSNGYAAVKPDFEYAVVAVLGLGAVTKLIIAEALRPALAEKLGQELPVVAKKTGAELVGKRYSPPFDTFAAELADKTVAQKAGGEVAMYWRVLAADFVTLDTGTGVVHIAPAFGEDDHEAHKAELQSYAPGVEVPLICAIQPDGTFVEEAGDLAGMWVKDADPVIAKYLQARELLVHQEKYRHDYPYCWRADDDPLIQLARPGWYIRTTARIDEAIANNRTIHWMPGHIQEGRFGDFLANNVDWALSRERFWGTPLNVWVCELDATHELAPDSVGAIEKLNPEAFAHFHEARAKDPSLSEHLIVHKPWIDQVTFGCTHTDSEGKPCGGTMRRVTEVIDAWFDSGSMPFAQWGFPHAPGSRERFAKAFPADFISEAIDQTRGWFYSLLMVSTLVFDQETQQRFGLEPRSFPHPYKNCVVLGHVGDREGRKESKSKGNYTPPEVILDRVRMDFRPVSGPSMGLADVREGVLHIAREDYEGLDLTGESAKLSVYRSDREGDAVELEVRPTKMNRRVVAISRADAEKLGVDVLDDAKVAKIVKPVEVPGLAQEERLTLEDTSAPPPGADAFRWFFYVSSPPWTNTRHSLSNVRSCQKEFVIKLRNVYSFFTIYASIDGFDPARGNARATGVDAAQLSKSEGFRPGTERSLLDRWLLSELSLATRDVRAHLDAYRLYEAAQRLVDLVDGLSNWYVRRSRARFWSPSDGKGAGASGDGQDKSDAYFTLYEALTTMARLMAPFTPFFAEELYQNLVRGPWPESQPESVHLVSFPQPDEAAIDEALAEEMRAVRDLVSLGLQVRTNNKLKVRQPLSNAEIVLSKAHLREALGAHAHLIAEELNVHAVHFLAPGEEGEVVAYSLKPNFRSLGPKLGKKVQLAKKALAAADAGALRIELAQAGKVTLDLDGESYDIGPEDIQVAVVAAEGYAAAGDRVGVVVLHTALDDALRDEGLAREILARIQALRKELALGFTDRAIVHVGGSDRVRRVADANRDEIGREALCEITVDAPDGQRALELLAGPADHQRIIAVDGEQLTLELTRKD